MIRSFIILCTIVLICATSADAFAGKRFRGAGISRLEGGIEMSSYYSGGPYFGNIIPSQTYYIAAESDAIAGEYKFIFMSPEELHETNEYRAYGTYLGEFRTGVESLVEIRAHVICVNHGLSLDPPKDLRAETFSLKYVQTDSFPESKAFRVDLPSDMVPVSDLPRVKWSFSPNGKASVASLTSQSSLLGPDAIFVPHRGVSMSLLMEANRNFFLSAGAQNSKFSPHLVFTELYCRDLI